MSAYNLSLLMKHPVRPLNWLYGQLACLDGEIGRHPDRNGQTSTLSFFR